MNQIAVTKITKTKAGVTTRHMTLPENVWEDIVANGSGEANVTWEKRKVQPVSAKEVELVKPDLQEVELAPKTEEPVSEEESSEEAASPAETKGTKKAKSKSKR